MILYVAFGFDYENTGVLGVFSTEEFTRDYLAREIQKPMLNREHSDYRVYGFFRTELDKPIPSRNIADERVTIVYDLSSYNESITQEHVKEVLKTQEAVG